MIIFFKQHDNRFLINIEGIREPEIHWNFIVDPFPPSPRLDPLFDFVVSLLYDLLYIYLLGPKIQNVCYSNILSPIGYSCKILNERSIHEHWLL